MSDDHKGPDTAPDQLYKPRPGRTYAPANGQLVPHAKDLAALPDGERIKDVVGDVWEKRDGWWCCLDASLRGEALLRVWGPVTRTQEPAIVTYGGES